MLHFLKNKMLAFNNSQSSRRFNWVQTFFALQRSFEEKSYWLILYSSLNGAATGPKAGLGPAAQKRRDFSP